MPDDGNDVSAAVAVGRQSSRVVHRWSPPPPDLRVNMFPSSELSAIVCRRSATEISRPGVVGESSSPSAGNRSARRSLGDPSTFAAHVSVVISPGIYSGFTHVGRTTAEDFVPGEMGAPTTRRWSGKMVLCFPPVTWDFRKTARLRSRNARKSQLKVPFRERYSRSVQRGKPS